MSMYLYLSMTPESLVASTLPPEEFGSYLAIGTRKASRGEAMFFDLTPNFQSSEFDLAAAAERCAATPEGQSKPSLYLGIYRVLERVPLSALNKLWLATARGMVLGLEAAETMPAFAEHYYLYQEVCPVHPLIASRLAPPAFCRFITDAAKALYVPKICFVQLDLADLALDPEHGQPRELYFPDHFWHLRGCLLELQAGQHKHTKTVDRTHPQYLPYTCIRNGFFVGDHERMLYYPFPTRAELEGKYYYWWRGSAHR